MTKTAPSEERVNTTRSIPCREDFFDTINTEARAYWLGFIAAIGCIHTSDDGRTRLSITLRETNVEHLRAFLHAIKSAVAISRRGKGCVGFSLTCARMTTALMSHGIVRRKSLRLRFPTTIPFVLVSHFIRGYFDGHGSVWESRAGRVAVMLTGAPKFLERVQREINAAHSATIHGCLSLVKRRARLIYTGRRSVAAIERYLYRGARCYIAHKRARLVTRA